MKFYHFSAFALTVFVSAGCAGAMTADESTASPVAVDSIVAPSVDVPLAALPVVTTPVAPETAQPKVIPELEPVPQSLTVEAAPEAVFTPQPLTTSNAVTHVEDRRPEPLTRAYVVKDGETLWTIAARPELYGDALLWSLLYQANRDQIKDPRQIYPDQVLSVPRNLSAEELQAAREWSRKSEIFPVKNTPAKSP